MFFCLSLAAVGPAWAPSGGSISVEVQRDAEDASIDITDTGRGMSPEDLPRIFDRSYRAASSSGTEADGSGLGLAIVEMIVDLHGGRVAVASDAGKGSTFSLYLPQRAPVT